RDGDPQVPEPHVVELAGEFESGGLLHQSVKVEAAALRARGDRRVKKPSLTDVDPPEELPVPVQLRAHDAVGGATGKAREAIVERARAEHREHHDLVEVGPAAL